MRGSRFYRAVSLLAILGGCAVAPAPAPEPAPPAPEPAPQPVAEVPQGTARELFLKGLDALQDGDEDTARPLLQQAIVLEPGHKNAAILLSQLGVDPVAMLGKEKFPYKVQPGDTLSRIARRFLGEPLKFYVLARYNNIPISDRLEAGKVINIPGKKPPPGKPSTPAVEQYAVPDISQLKLAEARKLYGEERYADALNLLERTHSESAANAELNDFLLTAYLAYAKKLSDAGQSAEAAKILSRASATFPGNERLRKQSEHMNAAHHADQAYREGNQLLSEGQFLQAYASFTRTLKLAPEHAGAKAAIAKIRPQLVENYYTDYVRARRRQHFSEALQSLDKLLEIDPNHELAKSNRAEIKAIIDREQLEKRR
jgi:tetratricopeptide (TPR) repeat protein